MCLDDAAFVSRAAPARGEMFRARRRRPREASARDAFELGSAEPRGKVPAMSERSPFARRRERVLSEIGQGVLVVFAASPVLRNNDVRGGAPRSDPGRHPYGRRARDLRWGFGARTLQGSRDQAEADVSYKPFFMHKTSHYLGMDVHDVGRYFFKGKPRPLEPGVVITIEPGLHFAREASNIDEKYRGIGVRIEDDLLIEATGARILTSAIPKQPDDVERACGR